MNNKTKRQLYELEKKYSGHLSKSPLRLKVYYGFSKINKIQKREAIQVTFENEQGAGSEGSRSGKTLRKIMNIVTERYQTEQEAADAVHCNKMFTSYYVFLDDKKIRGSLKKALQANSIADENNISEAERKRIKERLETAYMATHIGYQEPVKQLTLNFDE